MVLLTPTPWGSLSNNCIHNQLGNFQIMLTFIVTADIQDLGCETKVPKQCYLPIKVRIKGPQHVPTGRSPAQPPLSLPLSTSHVCHVPFVFLPRLHHLPLWHAALQRAMPDAFLMAAPVMFHIKNLLICMAQATIVNYFANNRPET